MISVDVESSGWILGLDMTTGRSVAEEESSDVITDPVSRLLTVYWVAVGVSLKPLELVSTSLELALAALVSLDSNAVDIDESKSERVLDASVVAAAGAGLAVVPSVIRDADSGGSDRTTELGVTIDRSVLV